MVLLARQPPSRCATMSTATSLITRKEYLSDSSLFRAYYAQFVTPAHFARIRGLIDRIKASQDPHLNDISISIWDRLAVPVPHETAEKMKLCGDYPTLSGAVCTLKEAARQIRESK